MEFADSKTDQLNVTSLSGTMDVAKTTEVLLKTNLNQSASAATSPKNKITCKTVETVESEGNMFEMPLVSVRSKGMSVILSKNFTNKD